MKAAWILFIAFVAMLSQASAFDECDVCDVVTVPEKGIAISTADSDVVDRLSSTYFYAGVEIMNFGHQMGSPDIIAHFAMPMLLTSQVEDSLLIFGELDTLVISDAKGNVIDTTTESIMVKTVGDKTLSGEINVTVKTTEEGTTVIYDEIGIEVYQSVNYPDIRVRSLNGASISVEGTDVNIGSINEIWVFDP